MQRPAEAARCLIARGKQCRRPPPRCLQDSTALRTSKRHRRGARPFDQSDFFEGAFFAARGRAAGAAEDSGAATGADSEDDVGALGFAFAFALGLDSVAGSPLDGPTGGADAAGGAGGVTAGAIGRAATGVAGRAAAGAAPNGRAAADGTGRPPPGAEIGRPAPPIIRLCVWLPPGTAGMPGAPS